MLFIEEEAPEAEETYEAYAKKKKKLAATDEFHYGDKNSYKYPAVGSRNRMKIDSALSEVQQENGSSSMISLSYFN